MRKFGLVLITGELLEKLIAPLFPEGIPRDMTIMKVVPSEKEQYSFNIVFTHHGDEAESMPEGATIPPITYHKGQMKTPFYVLQGGKDDNATVN